MYFVSDARDTQNKETTMQTTTNKRAGKGGEFGANGEWYEGGRFINTVAANPKRLGTVARKPRKVEIEPYVWVEAAEGQRSIYREFAGLLGRWINGRLVVSCSDVTLNYLGKTREYAQQLADRYNAGERWIAG